MKKLILCLFCYFVITSQFAAAYEEKLILLDNSLSMNAKLNGIHKNKLAIEAVNYILKSLKRNEKVGLRIIQADLSSPYIICRETNLISPIAENNSDNIKNILSNTINFPLGTTPLVYAIDTAIHNDFSSSAKLKHIILITDGMDECGQNPCEYIKKLTSARKDIKIDIIALGAKAEDIKELKCLTDKTSGTIKFANVSIEGQNIYLDFIPVTTEKPDISVNSDIYYKTGYNINYNNFKNKKPDIIYKNFIFQFDY